MVIPSGALPLGLGCSRLGSVGGASNDEARALLQAALAEGIRVFDTANVYGQGDSERLVGEAIAGRDDCIVISKAGKYVAWQRRAALPLKSIIRSATRRSTGTRQRVSAARATPLPTRWDALSLAKSLDGSLRRLGRDHVDVFLLHSPSAEVIRAGEAIRVLDAARSAGKIGEVGVSADDAEAAMAALSDGRVRVLQVPLRPGSSEYDRILEQAVGAGVQIIAREILGGFGSLASREDFAGFARKRIADVVSDPRVAVPIVGSTRVATLSASASAARDAGPDRP